MKTRKSVSSTGKETREEGEHKRWESPRKRRKVDYVTMSVIGKSNYDYDHVENKEEEKDKEEEEEEEEEENSPETPHKPADQNNEEEEVGPEEQPVETESSVEPSDVHDEEQTKDLTADIVSVVSQRKPKLILHRLEHLQGDFHNLLNNVVLQQNGTEPMPTEEQNQDKIDFSEEEEEDTAEPIEISEILEKTVWHNSGSEHEEQDESESIQTAETVTTVDQAVGTSPSETKADIIKNEVVIVVPCPSLDLELEEIEDTPAEVILQDPHDSTEEIIEGPPPEDSPCTVLEEPEAAAPTSTEEDVMDLEQLKREKIKWQIKVLKLQEEYYTLQIQKLKQ